MNLTYVDKVAFVTGAAAGLGKASAVNLADLGAKVVVADIDFDGAAETAASIGEAALPLAVDVTEWAAVRDAFSTAVQHFGRLDLVHANAGIALPPVSIEDLDPARWSRVIDVNLTGAFHTAKAAVPYLKDTRGSIVFTSSIAATAPRPRLSAYGASKAGINGLTLALATELAPIVRVNAIAPGPSRTPMLKAIDLIAAADDDELVEQHAALLPMRRLIEPEEIAAAVAYLGSPLAASITGTILAIDSGRHL